jgi:hypothetical protein
MITKADLGPSVAYTLVVTRPAMLIRIRALNEQLANDLHRW